MVGYSWIDGIQLPWIQFSASEKCYFLLKYFWDDKLISVGTIGFCPTETVIFYFYETQSNKYVCLWYLQQLGLLEWLLSCLKMHITLYNAFQVFVALIHISLNQFIA